MIRERLYQLYWALERAITPGAESSQRAYARIVTSYVTGWSRWLELGCGHQLWPDWIPGQAETARIPALLVGFDQDVGSLKQNRLVHCRVAGRKLPFADGSFNLVTANMVFEHFDDPGAALREIRRVLTQDGVCIFHTPNAQYWQTALGRRLPQRVKNLLVRLSEHRLAADVYPTHYRINTEGAIAHHLQEAGFSVDRMIMLNTSSAGRILLLGPLVVLELLWIRFTRRPAMRRHRSTIIAVIRPCQTS
jgi:ubiquinone/menaquinone biosynthesis C-methylase UbiE